MAPRRNRAYEDLHEIHKKATFLAMTMLSVPLEWKIDFPKINELFVPNSMINRDPLITDPQHQLTKARVKLAVKHSIQTAFSILQREVDPHNKQLCGREIGCVGNRAKIAAEQQVDQTTTTAGDLAAVAAPVVKASNPTEEETASGSSPSTSKDVEIRGSKPRRGRIQAHHLELPFVGC